MVFGNESWGAGREQEGERKNDGELKKKKDRGERETGGRERGDGESEKRRRGSQEAEKDLSSFIIDKSSYRSAARHTRLCRSTCVLWRRLCVHTRSHTSLRYCFHCTFHPLPRYFTSLFCPPFFIHRHPHPLFHRHDFISIALSLFVSST